MHLVTFMNCDTVLFLLLVQYKGGLSGIEFTVTLFSNASMIFLPFLQRSACMVWEINMGVCPRLDFDNIMLFNCLGYNFNIYNVFEFLCNSIANS